LLPAKSNLRVLIVRLGAMGDILHALPAITALRHAHPDWFMGWAVEPHWRALVAAESKSEDSGRDSAMPLIDQVHRIPAKQWGRKPFRLSTLREIRALRKELRGQKYDVAIDLQGAVRSAFFGRWSGAKLIGESVPREFAARWFFHQHVETQGTHVIEQDLEVVSAIAAEELAPIRPCLPYDENAEAWAAQITASADGPVVILNAGAGWGAKRWPPERYGVVARKLSDAGCYILLNAGPGELTLAEAVQQASGGVTTIVEATLGRLIELTRRASLVIAGDTGPLHLACSLGKPVVGIFGPTDPERNGPFGCDFRVLRHPESQRDHTRHSKPEAGLLTISPDAVLSAAQELLARIPIS
jgi:heptosyltransferase I